MTTFIRKIRQILRYFLGTHDNKYIITDTGKKILISDNGFTYNTKSDTIFSRRDRSATVLTKKDKAITDFTFKSKSPTIWTRRTKL